MPILFLSLFIFLPTFSRVFSLFSRNFGHRSCCEKLGARITNPEEMRGLNFFERVSRAFHDHSSLYKYVVLCTVRYNQLLFQYFSSIFFIFLNFLLFLVHFFFGGVLFCFLKSQPCSVMIALP